MIKINKKQKSIENYIRSKIALSPISQKMLNELCNETSFTSWIEKQIQNEWIEKKNQHYVSVNAGKLYCFNFETKKIISDLIKNYENNGIVIDQILIEALSHNYNVIYNEGEKI